MLLSQLIISFLTGSHGKIKGGDKVTYLDVSVGVPGLLVCIEQVLFSILMFIAFNTREHKAGGSTDMRKRNFPRAVLDALNPADLIRGIAEAFGYLLGQSVPRSAGAKYANLGGIGYRRSEFAAPWASGQEIPLSAMNGPTAYALQAHHSSHQGWPLPEYNQSDSYQLPLLHGARYQGRGR